MVINLQGGQSHEKESIDIRTARRWCIEHYIYGEAVLADGTALIGASDCHSHSFRAGCAIAPVALMENTRAIDQKTFDQVTVYVGGRNREADGAGQAQ